MRLPTTSLLLAAALQLVACQTVKDMFTASNTVALEPVEGTGLSLSKIKLRPSKTTLISGGSELERKQLELILSGSITANQPADAHLAVRLACEEDQKTMAAPGLSFLALGKKKPGETLKRTVALRLGWSFDAQFDKCELELAYIQRSNNLAAPPSRTTSLGKLCYVGGTLSVGACAEGTLSRKAERALPTVGDLTAKFDRNPPAGKGGLTPAPGKPRPKFRIRFTHLQQRGTTDFPADGHSLIGHCQTTAGIERRSIGYPSQGNSVGSGEWQSMEHGWYFMDQPSACELSWTLGGGGFTPAPKSDVPEKREEFARYCVTPSGVAEGACKPTVGPAEAPTSPVSAPPSATAAPSASAKP